MDIKRFQFPAVPSYVVVDGKTEFNYKGNIAVCKSAKIENDVITAKFLVKKLVTKYEADRNSELGIFELPGTKTELCQETVQINNWTLASGNATELPSTGFLVMDKYGNYKTYGTIILALNNASNGDTIVLNENLSQSVFTGVTIPDGITIDLNGYKIE